MKRLFMCLLLVVAITTFASVSLADVAPTPQFCVDYEATCGAWTNTETTCDTWWYLSAEGTEGDTSGATQGCYAYHLGAAASALAAADSAGLIAHCAHAVGGEDADGNAPCTDDTPVVEPPDYDPCAGKVCGDTCSKCDPASDDCVAEEGQFCTSDLECLGTGVDNPPDCDDEPVPPPSDGPFSINDCWNEQCVAETQACQADPNCVAYNECYKGEDFDCQQAIADANPEAVELHQALRECGWQNCNDPSAGSCADPGKQAQDGTTPENRCGQWDDNWPCNCDEACTQFGDCCDDFNEVCGGGGGSTGGGGGACVPQCIGKSCGPDGCGGSCGQCQAGQACSAAGVCEASCQDACAETDLGFCEAAVANLCAVAATGCLEWTTLDCASDGGTCTGEGVCIPGDGTGTEPGGTAPGDSTVGDGEESGDGGGTSTAGCAGGPASSGTPFLLLLGIALLALVRRRSVA